MTFIGNKAEVTRFDEQLSAFKTSRMNFKPTWGVTDLRYFTTISGSATVDENVGEFVLDTTANGADSVVLRTRERGTYRAGATAQIGVGARYRQATLGANQFMQWGYYDDNNGFGWGADSTGIYTFRRNAASDTKVYQSSWDDPLDGTGRSGLTLSEDDGHVYLIEFLWYGYGDIIWHIIMDDGTQMVKVPVHRVKIDAAVSVQDPNQPITMEIDNAGTATAQNLYIGGHQFSIVDGNIQPEVRPVAEVLSNYTLANNTNWQPLIAVRAKSTLRSRDNSINVIVSDFEVSADVNLEVRLTIGGVTSNLTYGTPTGWDANETAAETKVTGGTALTTSSAGNPIKYGIAVANANKAVRNIRREAVITLGGGEEAILWCKMPTASAGKKVTAVLEWSEEW